MTDPLSLMKNSTEIFVIVEGGKYRNSVRITLWFFQILR